MFITLIILLLILFLIYYYYYYKIDVPPQRQRQRQRHFHPKIIKKENHKAKLNELIAHHIFPLTFDDDEPETSIKEESEQQLKPKLKLTDFISMNDDLSSTTSTMSTNTSRSTKLI
jgi:hypothetical protein